MKTAGIKTERLILILLLQTQIPALSCGTNGKQRWWNWRINEHDGAISDTVTLVWFYRFFFFPFLLVLCGKDCWCWVTVQQLVLPLWSAFLTRVSSLLLERPVLPSVVPSHSINFYSFIFHCSAVSSSYSTLTPLDNVRPTARQEPKLRADHLLFWAKLL